MAVAVVLETLVDAIGQPQQRELSKCREVSLPEVPRQRRVDLVRRVDVAVCHSSPQRLRTHIDEFDRVCLANDAVGHGLTLAYPGDRLDDVVEGFEVLDVDGRDDIDAVCQQSRDVFPTLRVLGSLDVGVRELVDERDLGPTRAHGRQVHLLVRAPAVGEPTPRHDLEAVDRLRGAYAGMCLDVPDGDVRAAVRTTATLGEHREGLADSRGSTEVDPQAAPAARLVHGVSVSVRPWPHARRC